MVEVTEAELNVKTVLKAASFVLGKDIENLNELTDNQLLFFDSLSRIEMSRAMCIQDVSNGYSYRQAARKYRISKDTARGFFVK
jgi:hypothetical protein